jgi:hypothetical protein
LHIVRFRFWWHNEFSTPKPRILFRAHGRPWPTNKRFLERLLPIFGQAYLRVILTSSPTRFLGRARFLARAASGAWTIFVTFATNHRPVAHCGRILANRDRFDGDVRATRSSNPGRALIFRKSLMQITALLPSSPLSGQDQCQERGSLSTSRLINIDRSSTSVWAIWRQRDRRESSMNFQPAGKVCLF